LIIELKLNTRSVLKKPSKVEKNEWTTERRVQLWSQHTDCKMY